MKCNLLFSLEIAPYIKLVAQVEMIYGAAVTLVRRSEENTEAERKYLLIIGRLSAYLCMLPGNISFPPLQFRAENTPLATAQVYFIIDATYSNIFKSVKFSFGSQHKIQEQFTVREHFTFVRAA